MAPGPIQARTDAILRRLVRRGAAAPVRKVLAKARPEDVAAAMQQLTGEQQRHLFALIDEPEVAALVLTNLPQEAVLNVASTMNEGSIVDLLEFLEPDDATDVVEVLPEELRNRVIAEMEGEDEHADALELLAWPSESAGGLMSPLAFRMPETATCGNAIITLQQHHEELEAVYYVYVTDDADRLTGVVSMRQLLIHPPNTPLVSVMNRDLITVGPHEDQEEVAAYVARYDLLAVPVVDSEDHLLGIVTVDDVIDVIRDEAEEDMLLMAGVHHAVPGMSGGGPVRLARQRAQWLLATACGGVGAEMITHLYGGSIDLAILAGFIPVVMGMGGNVGIQSTTIAVRGLATGEVRSDSALSFIWTEVRVGMLLGLAYSVLLGSYALIGGWPDPAIGVVVGLAVLMAIPLGSLLGSGLPVLLARLGQDPAVATGPFVTTGVDIMGIVIYFQIAYVLTGVL